MNKKLSIIAIIIILSGTVTVVYGSEHAQSTDGIEYELTPSYPSTGYKGQPFEIHWRVEQPGYPFSGEYVKIELYESGVYHSTLLEQASKEGTYTWIIPDSPTFIEGKQIYQIKATSLSDSDEYRLGGTFKIEKNLSMTVTSPTTETHTVERATLRIRWATDSLIGIGNVSIELYKNGTFHSTIVPSTRNLLTYDWVIPLVFTTDSTYQIKITSLYYYNVSDFSDYFTISHPDLVVTSPTAGEIWYKTQTYDISWFSDITIIQTVDRMFEGVTIELYKNGMYNSLIGSNITGTYSWIVPNDVESASDYQIKITGGSSLNYASAFSENFTIDDGYILITLPEVNSVLYKGETYTIIWTSVNAGTYLNIECINGTLSTSIALNTSGDGGSRYETPGEITSRSYSWKIPNEIPLGECDIQVSSITNQNVKGSVHITIAERQTPGFELLIFLIATISSVIFLLKRNEAD